MYLAVAIIFMLLGLAMALAPRSSWPTRAAGVVLVVLVAAAYVGLAYIAHVTAATG